MYIIHLGSSGFPYGNAQIQRIRLTFKSLKLAGYNPLIINKQCITEIQSKVNRYQGIPYVSTSVSKMRHDNFIGRNLNKLSGIFGEINLLTRKRKKISTAIYYNSSFLELIHYRILSRLLGFKLLIQYVEFRSDIKQDQNFFKRIKDKLFDNYCFYLCDGIIVISEFLRNRTIEKNPKLPILKIPAICDFEEFNFNTDLPHENYIMYCGTILYSQVIEFVVDVFIRLKAAGSYAGKLLLVIGGDIKNPHFQQLEAKIHASGFDNFITLRKNVPHANLISLYKKAELLIVPLRKTLQDIAGFHHKVGEYTASARPIISSDFGEINHYFRDGETAILADDFTVDAYFEKLSKILTETDKIAQIGKAGFEIGFHHLNYKTYSADLKRFITQINNS